MITKIFSKPPATSVDTWHSPEPWVRFGAKTLGGMIAALLALSVIFTINGAVVASGTVTVEGAYQTVQNADGGIIQNILVKNGDLVKHDQVLIELDDTNARAQLNVTRDRIDELKLHSARLQAERDALPAFTLPNSFLGRSQTSAIQAMIASHRALFKARTTAMDGQRNLLVQQIKQQQSLLVGLEAQSNARRQEFALAKQRLTGIRNLYTKGFANKQQLTSTERDNARLTGDLGRALSEVTRTQTGIAEARLRLAQLHKQHTQQTVEELRTVRTSLNELEETFKAQNARLLRVQLRAPLDGYVHGLAVHTQGGVLSPGAPVLQIIPTGRQLIIEARIKPTDIDKLKIGQITTVRLPALNARRTPSLKGNVSSLSPAQTSDPRRGDYFTVQITLPQSEIAKIGKTHKLIPGMPAEVFIETSPRSVMSYFLKPLIDAVSYALREE